MQEAPLSEVIVFGHDEISVDRRTLPDHPIIGCLESEISHMLRSRKTPRKVTCNPRRQVLINQEFHRHVIGGPPGQETA